MAKTAIVNAPATAPANPLVLQIELTGLVPAADVPIILAVVENHNAKPTRIFELIEEFDLSARQVAVLYEVRDNFGDEERPSLAALARLGEAFEELRDGDPDDIATTVIDACQRLQNRWIRRKLYLDQIIERIVLNHDVRQMTFDEAVELLEDPGTILNADGRIAAMDGEGDYDE